jgi:PAS domain S-box-containing protein
VLTLLMIEPIVTLALLAHPATHDFVRHYPADAAAEQYPVVEVGWFFWVHLVYTDALLLAATVVFVVSLARVSRVYWREAAALIAAALLPWIVNLLHNLNVAGFGRVDLTPAAFAVTAAVIVWGVFGRRLLGLSTIARSVVVETMRDGMLVLDAYGRIVDANQAAARILSQPSDRMIGQDLAQLLPDQPVLSAHHVANHVELGDTPVPLRLDAGGEARDYELTRGLLADSRGRRTGELLLLRDVTERRQVEDQLRTLLAARSRIVRVLQDSLRPAVLPRVPGLDLATRYRPAGDGSEIGGDFYDVFPLAGGRWALVLGDVSGKGGLALGVLPDPELHDMSLDLRVVDVLCLYTDGVTEARHGRELFGEDRLARCLIRTAHLTADEIAGRLAQQVRQFSGTWLRDDIAIVVVKPTGCGS